MEEVANKLPTFVTEEERGLQSSGLSVQNLETLKVDELHPLSPEVISRQATVNIGLSMGWNVCLCVCLCVCVCMHVVMGMFVLRFVDGCSLPAVC